MGSRWCRCQLECHCSCLSNASGCQKPPPLTNPASLPPPRYSPEKQQVASDSGNAMEVPGLPPHPWLAVIEEPFHPPLILRCARAQPSSCSRYPGSLQRSASAFPVNSLKGHSAGGAILPDLHLCFPSANRPQWWWTSVHLEPHAFPLTPCWIQARRPSWNSNTCISVPLSLYMALQSLHQYLHSSPRLARLLQYSLASLGVSQIFPDLGCCPLVPVMYKIYPLLIFSSLMNIHAGTAF